MARATPGLGSVLILTATNPPDAYRGGGSLDFGALIMKLRMQACMMTSLVQLLVIAGCAPCPGREAGMTIIIVHGTRDTSRSGSTDPSMTQWWRPNSSFATAIEEATGKDCWFEEFAWSGSNDHEARLIAGEQLARKLARIKRDRPKEAVFLVGHSHGGNVALAAVNQAEPNIVQGVILLACPHMGVKAGEEARGRNVQWLY